MATGIERRTLLSWTTEPDNRAPTRSAATGAESFTATSAGSTTTTVSTALTGATNDIYVGQILRCVAATNTQNIGVDVIITGFSAAGDTLTHTAFPAGTSSADQFITMLPPDPICAASSAAVTLTASARDETDVTPRGGTATDYWNGDYVVVRSSATETVGSAKVVTAFNNATGAFTHDGFSAGIGVGDLLYLRRFPKLWGPPTINVKREDLEHLSQRGNFDNDQSISGSKSWTCDWALPMKASGTAAGDGTVAVPPPELHRPLSSVFAQVASTGEAVGAGSTTSVVQVTDGTLAQFPIGSFVMDSAGRMAVVTASAADAGNPDDITVNPPLQRAPASGEILYGGFSYEPQVTGHLSMTFDAFIGGVTNIQMYGGMPTKMVLADFGRNKVPKLQCTYAGNFYVETSYATPAGLAPVFDTVRPFDAKDSLATLVATGTTTATRLQIKDASVDLGIQSAPEDVYTLPDATAGMRIVGFKPRITVTAFLDTTSPNDTFAELQRYMGGQSFSLMLQHGRDVGKSVGFYAHKCAWLSPTHGVSDNLRTITFVAEAVASELTLMQMFCIGFC